MHRRRLERGTLEAGVVLLPAGTGSAGSSPVVVDWSGVTAVVACSACGTTWGPFLDTRSAYDSACEHARGGSSPHALEPDPLPWPSRLGLKLPDGYRPLTTPRPGTGNASTSILPSAHTPAESLSALVGHIDATNLDIGLASLGQAKVTAPHGEKKFKPTAEDRAWARRMAKGDAAAPKVKPSPAAKAPRVPKAPRPRGGMTHAEAARRATDAATAAARARWPQQVAERGACPFPGCERPRGLAGGKVRLWCVRHVNAHQRTADAAELGIPVPYAGELAAKRAGNLTHRGPCAENGCPYPRRKVGRWCRTHSTPANRAGGAS